MPGKTPGTKAMGVAKVIRKVFRPSLKDRLASVPPQGLRQDWDIASTLQRAVQYAVGAGVEGDFAEFGTDSGFSASIIARTMIEFKRRPKRSLWLFDSFEGLPDATSDVDKSNPHVASGVWGRGKCSGLTLVELNRQIARFLPAELIKIEAGWFAETAKRIPVDVRFAIVHVDGDLYQSTIDALSPLFERKSISPGAVIVFDDWNCGRADNNLGERRAWRELAKKHKADFEDFGHHSWAGRSFILHSYS